MHNEFELLCQAHESWSAAPRCKPVQCGVVPEVAEATYPSGRVLVFPQEVHYAGKSGYITDQKAEHDGKNQKITS